MRNRPYFVCWHSSEASLQPQTKIRRYPLWAVAYYAYVHSAPNHRGKGWILRQLHHSGLRSGDRFVWPMENGTRLVVDPREGLLASETVGWTCFLERGWETHLERFVREQLRPGDDAIDVGANIGYFSAVMCQAVGSRGRVASFEPVDATREALSMARDLNHLGQLDIFAYALSDRSGVGEILFDPRVAGSASLHRSPTDQATAQNVCVDTLDNLVQAGVVRSKRLRLIKLDVEGAELDVLRGAEATIAYHRPLVILELNGSASLAAEWGLREVREFFGQTGDYRLGVLADGAVKRLPEQPLRADEYIDLVAIPARLPR
jgi:FkbM family methyltransferase